MTTNGNPLFWVLKEEDRAKLMMYQWNTYGLELDIAKQTPPNMNTETVFKFVDPSLDEIGKIMRQAPSRSRGNDSDEQ